MFTCNGRKNRSSNLLLRLGRVKTQVKLGGTNGWSLLVGQLNCHTCCSQLDATPKTTTLKRARLYHISYIHTSKYIMHFTVKTVGRCSSVGIATGYGLDGPGIESRWGQGFPNLSTQALGPTQPPVQ